MKGDFSRSTFDAHKHYRGVRLQQGRVLVDADWNEELDLFLHRVETEAVDVIGACGAPKHAAGFALSTDTTTLSAADVARLTARGVLPLKSGDFLIGAGRYYVDGSLCENDEVVTFTSQPDLPGVQPIGASGVYVAYLDVWERLITALEDPSIREVALGGPDTATRGKTIWQVKLLPAGEDGSEIACADNVTWPPASTGQLRARTEPNPPTTDPCVVPPGAGYRRLENQLYRIEIHRGSDDAAGPTFKWSRDNGSIVVAVEQFAPGGDTQKVKVKSLGRDHVLGLHKGDWVEVLDDATELNNQPGTLAKIDDIDIEHKILILNTSITGFDLNGHAKVRRWDSVGEVKVEVPLTNDGYIPIEDGVEIKFDLGQFNVGDYWLIPARTVPGQFGDIEWPRDAAQNPLPQLASGIHHHYCKLAIVTVANEAITNITDCRPIFPPLTELPLGGACCCTVSVGDGLHSQGDYTDIQTAIDALPDDGGTVCVLAGDYRISNSIVLRGRDHITISGCGSRTRLIAAMADPIFVIEGGDDVQLDSMNLAARSSMAAILARKITDLRIVNNTIINRSRIIIENRLAAAAGTAGPAIVIGSAIHVEIEHNRIGGLPAIDVLAHDLTIVDNFIRLGGIRVRSGSAEVVIDDNSIAEGAGPGIRLGNAGETDATTKEFFYAALKRAPAAETKTTRAGFSKAAYSRAGGLRAVAADGLAGVQITDNVIQHMDGSGITTFVDQVSNTDLIVHGDIEDLVIEGNEIVECVQNPPDAVLTEVSVAGGVLLSAITRVRIADNTIARNGLIDTPKPDQTNRHAACGLFIVEAVGVEISSNTITDNGSPTPDDAAGRAVFQAGIAALIVLGNSADVSDAVQGQFDLQPGLPALRVHDNVVSCPAGQALVVTALGSVSVSGNTLTSNGFKQQPTVLGQASGVLNIGACVTIFNLGRAALAANSAGFGVDSTVNAAAAVSAFPDGRTLFSDNQVTFTAAFDEKLRTLISAIAFFALDDVSLQDNQVAIQLSNGRVITTGFALALTLRASGNNFTEPLPEAMLSFISWAQLNVLSSNEAIHCMIALGTKVSEGNNLTLVSDDLCKQVGAALGKG